MSGCPEQVAGPELGTDWTDSNEVEMGTTLHTAEKWSLWVPRVKGEAGSVSFCVNKPLLLRGSKPGWTANRLRSRCSEEPVDVVMDTHLFVCKNIHAHYHLPISETLIYPFWWRGCFLLGLFEIPKINPDTRPGGKPLLENARFVVEAEAVNIHSSLKVTCSCHLFFPSGRRIFFSC